MEIPGLSSWKTKQIPRTWVILGMVAVAVPFVLFLLSMKGCACVRVSADSAPAARTGPDSIAIVMHPDASVHHDQPTVLTISVNDREVVSRSVVLQTGLPLAVSPREGPLFRDGAAVTLQGDLVAGNASVPVHIVTVAWYDTGEAQVIGDQMV